MIIMNHLFIENATFHDFESENNPHIQLIITLSNFNNNNYNICENWFCEMLEKDNVRMHVPLDNVPSVFSMLEKSQLYDFEFSISDKNKRVYRLEKITEVTCTRSLDDASMTEDTCTSLEEDVEPDSSETKEIAEHLCKTIEDLVDETKKRRRKLYRLRKKLTECKHDLKEVNNVYTQLNEYI